MLLCGSQRLGSLDPIAPESSRYFTVCFSLFHFFPTSWFEECFCWRHTHVVVCCASVLPTLQKVTIVFNSCFMWECHCVVDKINAGQQFQFTLCTSKCEVLRIHAFTASEVVSFQELMLISVLLSAQPDACKLGIMPGHIHQWGQVGRFCLPSLCFATCANIAALVNCCK